MIEIKKIPNFEDKEFKRKNLEKFNAYLKSLGCDIRAKMFLDTSITGISIGENIVDRIILTEDLELAIVEQEYNDPDDKAIYKELNYGTALLKRFDDVEANLRKKIPDIKLKKCVHKIMIVLNPTKVGRKIYKSPNCIDEKYAIDVFSPKFIDGDKRLKYITNKLENNIEENLEKDRFLDLEDYESLQFAILTKHSKEKHEIVIQVANIIEKSYRNVDNPRLAKSIRILQQRVIRYVKEKHQQLALRGLSMFESITGNMTIC